MSILITLARMTVFGAIGLVALAVTLGRMFPDPIQLRLMDDSGPVVIGARVNHDSQQELHYLDRVTGQLKNLRLPVGEALRNVSVSPWKDETGQWQAVGLWLRSEGTRADSVLRESALQRIRFPSGQPIDRVEIDVIPYGPVCWMPRTDARVIFGAADGRLYTVSFEDGDEAGRHTRYSAAVPLDWDVKGIQAASILLAEPYWLADARLGDRLVVSLTEVDEQSPGLRATTSIWWIEVDPSTLRIEAAGRLTALDDARGRIEMLPIVHKTRGGELFLGYISRAQGTMDYQIHIGPIEFDRATGYPRVTRVRSLNLPTDSRPQSAAFTVDGRYVLGITTGVGDLPDLVCISMAGILAGEDDTFALGSAHHDK